jgi:hypothetical protein
MRLTPGLGELSHAQQRLQPLLAVWDGFLAVICSDHCVKTLLPSSLAFDSAQGWRTVGEGSETQVIFAHIVVACATGRCNGATPHTGHAYG